MAQWWENWNVWGSGRNVEKGHGWKGSHECHSSTAHKRGAPANTRGSVKSVILEQLVWFGKPFWVTTTCQIVVGVQGWIRYGPCPEGVRRADPGHPDRPAGGVGLSWLSSTLQGRVIRRSSIRHCQTLDFLFSTPNEKKHLAQFLEFCFRVGDRKEENRDQSVLMSDRGTVLDILHFPLLTYSIFPHPSVCCERWPVWNTSIGLPCSWTKEESPEEDQNEGRDDVWILFPGSFFAGSW